MDQLGQPKNYRNIDPSQLTVSNKDGTITLNLNEQILQPIHSQLDQILQQHIPWILLLRDPEGHLAASVEGFKQQAPSLKDQIAAATFFELTSNPADRMEGKVSEARAPNPVLEWVMRKLKIDEEGAR